MTSKKRLVTIKGVKEGLIFQLDDDCEFDALLQELEEKLSSAQLMEGPEVKVQVQLGTRYPTDKQRERLTELIRGHSHLDLQTIESEVVPKALLYDETGRLKMIRTIVRSGQTVHHDGDLLLVGDVNAGGTILSTGDIFVLGSLRGMAHAGMNGNASAIVAASLLRPTQLRIAEVISRPPDEWGTGDTMMEFAYLNKGTMEIDKIAHLGRIRSSEAAIRGE